MTAEYALLVSGASGTRLAASFAHAMLSTVDAAFFTTDGMLAVVFGILFLVARMVDG